jgi:GTP-binding protein HflX
MDMYEQNTFDPWLEDEVRFEILRDLKERWERDTQGNCVFVSAIERRNVDELRKVILDKVKEAYQRRYPYKTENFY